MVEGIMAALGEEEWKKRRRRRIREGIIKKLKEAGEKGLRFEEFGIKFQDRHEATKILKEMENERTVIKTREHRYVLPQKHEKQSVKHES